jgi:hypothetical protein
MLSKRPSHGRANLVAYAIATGLAALAVPVNAVGQAGSSVVERTVVPISFTVEDPCSGELVLLDGTYRNSIVHVGDEERSREAVGESGVASGIGLESGVEYRAIFSTGGGAQGIETQDLDGDGTFNLTSSFIARGGVSFTLLRRGSDDDFHQQGVFVLYVVDHDLDGEFDYPEDFIVELQVVTGGCQG